MDKIAKYSCAECGDDYFPDEAGEHDHAEDDKFFASLNKEQATFIPMNGEEWLDQILGLAEDKHV